MTYKNEDYYLGDWVNDLRDGKGILKNIFWRKKIWRKLEKRYFDKENYFKIKGKIFINLFNDYEKIYCLNNNYIFILLKNTINSKLNKYINILNISSIELFNLNEDWNTIIQSYEENIKNIRVKEKETQFLRKSEIIYNIIISNCQINNQLKNLLNIIKMKIMKK